MTQITFDIPNTPEAVELLDNFCFNFKYREQVDNPSYNPQEPEDPITNPKFIDNPETKVQFLKRITIQWWRGSSAHGQGKKDHQAMESKYNLIDIT